MSHQVNLAEDRIESLKRCGERLQSQSHQVWKQFPKPKPKPVDTHESSKGCSLLTDGVRAILGELASLDDKEREKVQQIVRNILNPLTQANWFK